MNLCLPALSFLYRLQPAVRAAQELFDRPGSEQLLL